MTFHHKSLIIFCALLAGAQPAMTQDDKVTGSVDIYKDFDARLLESNKINLSPTLPPIDTNTVRQDYIVPPRPLTIDYEAPQLRPLGMRSGKKEDPYNGFAKLGGGVPKTFWGEAGYYFSSGEQFDGKVWVRHHSLNADNSVENQRFFNNDALIGANVYVSENLAVEGNLGYSFDRVHFYGYNVDTLSFSEERTRQDYKMLNLGGRVYNSERNDADMNFSVSPKFYLLNDFYSNKETGFDFNLSATKWFDEKHPLNVTIRTDLTTFDDTAKQKLNNIYLQPNFTFHSDILNIRVGGNFASNRDEFKIFPDAEITLRLVGNGIQIFGGAGGDLRKNTYRSISEYNPFIQIRGAKLRNTEYRNYYAGIKGDFGFLEYTGQFSYATANDLALFQTNFESTGLTRFQTVYDTAKITNIQGTVKLKPIDGLLIIGTLSQNIAFDVNNQAQPWGVPKLEGNFNAVLSVLDGKAKLRGGLYIADGIWFKDQENITRQKNGLFDVSLGGNYYFSDNIGAFLDINNILNNKRERWFNYPVVGLNFMAGLTARF
ncbi:MAG: hypothetical protein H6575_04800 [Lewinellaceae bacterium]|nr:hypothetical protein [Saprospiraceae bacterium]MCB9353865.1 hypothetical protein [Lewinellaceae bacterium]